MSTNKESGSTINPTALVISAESLLHRRHLSEALRMFDLAERAGAIPDRCAAGRWIAHMLCGNFSAAWHESDSIRNRMAPDPHRFWEGQDLRSKRVIVRCLHGFGDAVQFLRYVPRLCTLTAHLIVQVPPRMLELAPFLCPESEVITWSSDSSTCEPVWDVQIEIMELPYIFRTNLEELPMATKYLQLSPEIRAQAAIRMPRGSFRRVGVAWNAGEWNRSRSVPFQMVEGLLDIEGCEFWNLDGGPNVRHAINSGAYPSLRQATGASESILILAGVISQLDLVITVDTLAAHLAGALGIPAWLMLQHSADWRWLHGRSDSPWYPSLRLFRQATPGDWQSVIQPIRSKLFHPSPPAECSATMAQA